MRRKTNLQFLKELFIHPPFQALVVRAGVPDCKGITYTEDELKERAKKDPKNLKFENGGLYSLL